MGVPYKGLCPSDGLALSATEAFGWSEATQFSEQDGTSRGLKDAAKKDSYV
jgi:hypothetical protein